MRGRGASDSPCRPSVGEEAYWRVYGPYKRIGERDKRAIKREGKRPGIVSVSLYGRGDRAESESPGE